MAQEAARGTFVPFNASGYRVAIVAAAFNNEACDLLLASALKTAEQYSISPSRVRVCRVPGSVEIPVILRACAVSKQYNCLVALGCVVRGETSHFDYVAKIVSEGVLRVMMDYGVPVGFGVLTCNTQEQALARTGVGGDAMEAALQSAKIIREL